MSTETIVKAAMFDGLYSLMAADHTIRVLSEKDAKLEEENTDLRKKAATAGPGIDRGKERYSDFAIPGGLDAARPLLER